MNQVVLIGNLTKDPETRQTNSGKSVCNFTLAVSERKQDPKSGEWVDDTNFIPIVVWGKQGENCGRFLGKGKKCAVNGRIVTGSYTNQQGQKVYTTDVVAYNVEFLSPKNEQSNDQTFNTQQFNTQQNDVPVGFEAVQEEIPF